LKKHGKIYKQDKQSTKKLSYYSEDDMVTLFLNLGDKIRDKKSAKRYVMKAVGADKKKGRVDVIIPKKSEAKKMKKLVGKTKQGEWLMRLIMHRKLYSSKKGELLVRMGKDSIIQKAVLKDILLFGDVRIIRQ